MTELLTSEEMAQADRLAIAGGIPGIELMESAGRAVADLVGARHPPGSAIVVVAGPGNNGGDGFVAARILSECNYQVRVLLVGRMERLKGDAVIAAGRWQGPTEPATPAGLTPADIVVDALFGAGLDRPVEGVARVLIEAMNDMGRPVYAVDLPSGINGTSGKVMGVAVRAAETVTFFRSKPGHVLLPGRLHCGHVHVAQIGIPESVLVEIKPRTFLNAPGLWGRSFPIPNAGAHKYARGHAVVISGELSMTGAARLAARGALRAGAGLVTIASPRNALQVNATANTAVMVRAVDGAVELGEFLSDVRRNVVVLGPGGGVGQAMRDLVYTALAAKCAVILDADALTSFAGELELLAAAIRDHEAATILTPHDGEFARLFKTMEHIVKATSKLEKVRLAAQATGAVCLLKGSDTVVAAPDGRATITENAPPWLATAGSGDVLAGLIAGLLAQGMAGFEAASAGVWLHGETGTEAGPGLIAEDLPEAVPKVYRRFFAELLRDR